MTQIPSTIPRLLMALAVCTALYGCAAEHLHREGLDLISAGRYEEGLAKLDAAAKSDTADFHYRAQFTNKREEIINRLLASATSERAGGNPESAEAVYRRVLRLDPGNERAQAGMAAVETDRRHARLIAEAHELFKQADPEAALARLQPILAENPGNAEMRELKRSIEEQQARQRHVLPTLNAMYKKPVNLEFRDANLKMVLEMLSRTTGINFILDKEVRPDLKITIFVRQTSLEDAVGLLLATNQLEKKVLNSSSVLIYPNTPAKQRDYQDLVVKSFYLENADVKQTAGMVKMLLKTREIYTDDKLNLMIMRDTPETIRLAEKLIAMQDLAEPEVMLEVEVLEVKRSRLRDLGIQYPDQLTLTPLPATTGGKLTLNDLININAGSIGATITSPTINLKSTSGDVNLLANPRIRARNREKAKIMIGDKVPVITTTTGSTGFVSDSVQYVDVGLKLEVEPNIYLRDDVAIRVALEVSSIVDTITSANGTRSYQIGSRNATTVLRLKDGETQVLAGLINDEDRATANKVPGLGDLPVLGRLFSTHHDDSQKTEIVLSITPHLVRNLQRPEATAAEFWSGTETMLRTAPPSLQETKSGVPPQAPVVGRIPAPVSLPWEGPAEVKTGERFKIALRLSSDNGLRSLPLQIGYDPVALRVVEVAEGDFSRQDGTRTRFTGGTDDGKGKITVDVTRADDSGNVAGDERVTAIFFEALVQKSRTEVTVSDTTPLGSGDRNPAVTLPPPYVLTIR